MRLFVLKITQRTGQVQTSIHTILLYKATCSLNSGFFNGIVGLVISGQGKAHLSAARSGKNNSGITGVGAEQMCWANKNDSGGASSELGNIVVFTSAHSSGERIRVAILLLNLPQALGTCGLQHQSVHFSENGFKSCFVVLRSVFFEFYEFFDEHFFDPDGHFLSSVTIKDTKDMNTIRKVCSANMSIFL